MKRLFSFFVLVLIYSGVFGQETYIGKVAFVQKPCTISPCMPDTMLYDLETASDKYILVFKSQWIRTTGQLIIEDIEYFFNDEVEITGKTSVKQDAFSREYIELEIATIKKANSLMLSLSFDPDANILYNTNKKLFEDEENFVRNKVSEGMTVYLWIKDNVNKNDIARQDCELASSNPAVATIAANGAIAAVAAGTATIKAVRKSDGAEGSIFIKVIGAEEDGLTLTLFSEPDPSNKIVVGKKGHLLIENTIGGYRINASDCELTSSNPAVATITPLQEVNAVALGTTTITAVRKSDGAVGYLTITVVEFSVALTLDLSSASSSYIPVKNSPEVAIGNTVYLYVTDAKGTVINLLDCELTSSHPGVVSIDAAGRIKALAFGSARLKAVKKSDGSSYGTLMVGVVGNGNVLTLILYSESEPYISTNIIDVGKIGYLEVKNPTGIRMDRSEYKLVSSDTDVAIISTYGTLVSVAPGTTTLKAVRKSDDTEGNLSVTVLGDTPPEDNLTLVISNTSDDFSEIISSIKVDENAYLYINSGGNSLNSDESILTSSDDAIATISSDGTITGLAPGTVEITVVNEAGEGTISLKVEDSAVNVITLEKAAIKVKATETGIAVQFEGEATIELYAINGILIDKAQACQSYFHSLDKGIYVIRVNGQVIKFVK